MFEIVGPYADTAMKELKSQRRRDGMRTGVLVLLCIMLIGTWPQTVQAELSDDPLPPSSAADCEMANSEWEKIKCGVKTIVGFAKKISEVYSGFNGTFEAATFLGRVL